MCNNSTSTTSTSVQKLLYKIINLLPPQLHKSYDELAHLTYFYHTNRSSSNLTNFTSLVQFVLANLTNSNLTATGLVRIWPIHFRGIMEYEKLLKFGWISDSKRSISGCNTVFQLGRPFPINYICYVYFVKYIRVYEWVVRKNRSYKCSWSV